MDQKSVEKMGAAPVKNLMLSMGIPVIISMMLQALYNIVDSAFVSNMEGGESALNALTLAFPVQMLMSFMTYGINLILVQVSEGAVTAYGLYYKIQQFILFAAFGLRDTITPIVSFSHGMRSKERITAGIKYGILDTLVIMAVGTLLLELFAGPICSVFKLSGATESLCVSAIRIISIGFVFAGTSIALQGVLQALDCGLASLIISILRQLLLVLPVAWIFTLFITADCANAWIVWLTFSIAEIVTAEVACLFMVSIYRKKIKSM